MKTFLTLMILAASASSVAAQVLESPAAAPPAAPPPAAAPPAAAPAAPPEAAPAPQSAPPLSLPTPQRYEPQRYQLPPPQRLGAPPRAPILIQPAPRPYPPPPRRLAPPPYHPLRREPRVYGNAGAPFALGIGGAVSWRDEDHERFGNGRSVGGFDMFASYDVLAAGPVILAGGLSYRNGERHRGDRGELRDHLLSADLIARTRAASWLWPHVRVGIGVATTKVNVDGALDFEDRAAGVAGSFGAGFTLRTPKRAFETYRGKLASLSLGIMLEGGYTVAQDAELSPTAKQKSDIPSYSAASFTATRSAGFLRILGVIRF